MLHRNGIILADLMNFKNQDIAMNLIWERDMDILCYRKSELEFCETFLVRYRIFYKNVLKKCAKFLMARNLWNVVFVTKSVLLCVLSVFSLVLSASSSVLTR